MNRIPILAALASLSLTVLTAQEPTQPGHPDTKAAPPATDQSIGDLVRRLGDPSFKVRLQAEQDLMARGEEALPELRKAAKDSDDAEVQWRARRLVRRIESGDEGTLGRRGQRQQREPNQDPWYQPRVSSPFGGEDIQQRFDELFGRLERDFGMDIPRSRFFDDSFFKDLDQQMQTWRDRMQHGGSASGQSMSMQIGPDGVRVEVQRKNDKGEDDKQVYEAPDLETFRSKYPGVLEQNGLGGVRLFGGLPGQRGMLQLDPMVFDQVRPFARWHTDGNLVPDVAADVEPVPLPPPGKRLGVVVAPEVPAGVREYLGLDADEGLMIESIQDDTLAQRLELRKGDIVVDINGHPIRGTKDIQDALGAIDPGKSVEVKVLRRGREQVLRAAKPANEEASKEHAEETAPEPAKPVAPRRGKKDK